MASIRRSLSPLRRFSTMMMKGFLSLLHKPSPSPSGKWAHHHHHHHHHHHRQWRWWRWKRYFLRLFIFFVLGLLVGLSPFAHLQDASDLRPHHLFFDSISRTKIIMNSNPNSHSNLGADPDPDPDPEPFPPPVVPITIPEQQQQEKLVIVVTPTYSRGLQAYYLTRLGQTLRLVPPPLLWIVVEMESASMETADSLRRSGVMYRHLVCCDTTKKNNKNNKYKEEDCSTEDIKDRGVHQRNTALQHIRRHLLDGIVYFADDDNIYSLHLFHHLRNIRCPTTTATTTTSSSFIKIGSPNLMY